MSSTARLLPDPELLRLDYLYAEGETLTLVVTTCQGRVLCPCCGGAASRVHSRYRRQVADLPWNGLPVRLRICCRKFFCDEPTCPRRIFTEPLPSLVRRYGRRTLRLADAFWLIGYLLGGEAGARVARGLGLVASPDTLLRRLRQETQPASTPRVLGVDDWAFRRGQRYGTILVDLERRRVVDLLEDRCVSSLADWLREHPGVEVISRDRGGPYSEGAAAGAPGAVQVADRWHLLKNLADAIEALLAREHRALHEAAQLPKREDPVAVEGAAEGDGAGAAAAQPPAPRQPTQAQRQSAARRERRLARYERVVELSQEGHSIRGIARIVGLTRKTVSVWLKAGSFPERAARRPAPGWRWFGSRAARLEARRRGGAVLQEPPWYQHEVSQVHHHVCHGPTRVSGGHSCASHLTKDRLRAPWPV